MGSWSGVIRLNNSIMMLSPSVSFTTVMINRRLPISYHAHTLISS